LHVAVLNGNLDIVRLLLWKDADVDIKNKAGWTPLHEASKNGSLEICSALLHKNADPKVTTGDGSSALHYLVSRKFDDADLPLQEEVISQMLALGADVNHHTNSNEETPLHYCAMRGLNAVARILLDRGANINVKNKRGYTPLHIAILQAQQEMLKIFLEYGADMTISSKDGTCTELAKGNAQMLQIINEHANKTTPLPSPTKSKAPDQSTPDQSTNDQAMKKVSSRRSLPPVPPKKGEDVSKLPYYYGTLERSVAEQMVTAYAKDCLMLRASSVKDCFALTVCSKTNQHIMHLLVYPRSSGGYSIQDCEDTNTYGSLSELISKSPICAGFAALAKKEDPTPPSQQQPSTPPSSTQPSPVQSPTPPPQQPNNLKVQLEKAQNIIATTLSSINQKDALTKNKEQLKVVLKDLTSLL